MSRKSDLNISVIAEEAGVSIATVSRVLNNKGSVKKETELRVKKALAELDKDNLIIHKYNKKTDDLIVAVICDNGNPMIESFLSGIRNCASSKGFHVLQYNCFNNSVDKNEFEYILNNLPVAGLILHRPVGGTDYTDYLASKVPTVMSLEQYKTDQISCICVNDFEAAKSVVEFLNVNKRKKIALLNGDHSIPFAHRREEGYKAALATAGIEFRPEYIAHVSDFNFNLAQNAAREILVLPEPPDAFFAINDTFAAAVLKEALRLGLSVPKDLAIIGFDNTFVSSMTDPSITTVGQPSYQIGYQSCITLINKIINPAAPSQQVWVNTEFIIREST